MKRDLYKDKRYDTKILRTEDKERLFNDHLRDMEEVSTTHIYISYYSSSGLGPSDLLTNLVKFSDIFLNVNGARLKWNSLAEFGLSAKHEGHTFVFLTTSHGLSSDCSTTAV